MITLDACNVDTFVMCTDAEARLFGFGKFGVTHDFPNVSAIFRNLVIYFRCNSFSYVSFLPNFINSGASAPEFMKFGSF